MWAAYQVLAFSHVDGSRTKAKDMRLQHVGRVSWSSLGSMDAHLPVLSMSNVMITGMWIDVAISAPHYTHPLRTQQPYMMKAFSCDMRIHSTPDPFAPSDVPIWYDVLRLLPAHRIQRLFTFTTSPPHPTALHDDRPPAIRKSVFDPTEPDDDTIWCDTHLWPRTNKFLQLALTCAPEPHTILDSILAEGGCKLTIAEPLQLQSAPHTSPLPFLHMT